MFRRRSGDEILKEQIRVFSPASEYVVVKKSAGGENAMPRPRTDVTADIEAAAARAWRIHAHMPAWRPTGTEGVFDNRFSYMFPEMAAVAINFPHVTGVDNKTVGLKSADFVEAYLDFRALANFTQVVRQRMVMKLVGDVEGGHEILARAQALWPSRDKRTFDPTAAEVDMTATPYGRRGVK